MVRAQDLAYRTRQPCRDPNQQDEGSEEANSEEPSWRGRGTSALFMVNRELSELAAAHLFTVRFRSLVRREGADVAGAQDVRSKRARESAFTSLVLRRRAQHFRHAVVEDYMVDYGQDPEEDAKAIALSDKEVAWFLSILFLFSNLSTLTIGMNEIYLYLEIEIFDGSVEARALEAFRAAAKRVRHLVLRNVSLNESSLAPDASKALRHFSRLTSLSLQETVLGGHGAEFLETLAALSFLEELSLVRLAKDRTSIDWRAPRWTNRNLRRLHFRSHQPQEDLPLLEVLSATLESFDINLRGPLPPSPTGTFLANTTFPRLHSLRLQGPIDEVLAFLSLPAFSSSPISHLELKPEYPVTSASGLSTILNALKLWPTTLRHASFLQNRDDQGELRPASARAVELFCRAQEIRAPSRVAGVLLWDSSFYRALEQEAKDEETDAALADVADVVERALEFGRRAMEGIQARRDVRGIAPLLGVLSGLLDMQAAAED